MIARGLMGLTFLVVGLNGFFFFLPQPTTMPPAVVTFMGGLMATGYMMRLLAGVQVLVGLLLLANRFVPLALALIAPVIVNIVLFHLVVWRSGLPGAAVVAVLEVYLAWIYRRAFYPMLAMRVNVSER
jgi:hypothetical protein